MRGWPGNIAETNCIELHAIYGILLMNSNCFAIQLFLAAFLLCLFRYLFTPISKDILPKNTRCVLAIL